MYPLGLTNISLQLVLQKHNEEVTYYSSQQLYMELLPRVRLCPRDYLIRKKIPAHGAGEESWGF